MSMKFSYCVLRKLALTYSRQQVCELNSLTCMSCNVSARRNVFGHAMKLRTLCSDVGPKNPSQNLDDKIANEKIASISDMLDKLRKEESSSSIETENNMFSAEDHGSNLTAAESNISSAEVNEHFLHEESAESSIGTLEEEEKLNEDEKVMKNRRRKTVNQKSKKMRTSEIMSLMNPTLEDVEHFLQHFDMKKYEGHSCIVVNCLTKSTTKLPRFSSAIYINKMSGYFTCFACNKHGPLSVLYDRWNYLKKCRISKKKFTCFPEGHAYKVSDIQLEEDDAFKKTLKLIPQVERLKKEEYAEVQTLFGLENVKKCSLVAHQIRYYKEKKTLFIPYYDFKGIMIDCKVITPKMDEDDEVTGYTSNIIYGPGRKSLFGWRKSDKEKKQLILTKTELDAIAAQQVLHDYCVLSLPNESQFPQEVLPYLERFEKIVLWFGGTDYNSWRATVTLAKKLGDSRCHVFRPIDESQTPLELVRDNISLHHVIKKTKPMSNDYLINFQSIRNEVWLEIFNHEDMAGTKWQRYEHFNKVLKGFRPGELTVFSGRTGTGKTTFMSEYSLDLCMQGVNTLWGSFEVNNVRLAKTMLTQFAKKNLSMHLEEFEQYANDFQNLPMYFMTFFGQEDVKKIIDTMAHAVFVYDIQHVILDNLQFMLGDEMASVDKFSFSKQNLVYSSFRRFASEHNCHITLVIHPRKENDDLELTTSSIFGSAKATQEADNVMLLQRKPGVKAKKYIQITKNRYDGELGNVPLQFDSANLTMSNTKKRKKEKREGDTQTHEDGSENMDNQTHQNRSENMDIQTHEERSENLDIQTHEDRSENLKGEKRSENFDHEKQHIDSTMPEELLDGKDLTMHENQIDINNSSIHEEQLKDKDNSIQEKQFEDLPKSVDGEKDENDFKS